MLKFCYGGKTGRSFTLKENMQLLVVRTASRIPLTGEDVFAKAPLSRMARTIVGEFDPVVRFDEAGVEVLCAVRPRAAREVRDRARAILTKEPAIEFAGRGLTDSRWGEPVVYTENFFVKFNDNISPRVCVEIIQTYGLEVKRPLKYARNAYFVAAPKGTGQKIFAIAECLLGQKEVELCHPELIRRRRNTQAFPPQWHLKRTRIAGRVVDQHANVKAAWQLSDGRRAVIAVIDDGVDLAHEEFRSPGKITAPRDVFNNDNDPRPRSGNMHGNACAGVACADGNFGASGVAPRARLMPIRAKVGSGSQVEADAIDWAARKGADVISCSWGPYRAEAHKIYWLPDSTKKAIDFATKSGRGGRGCVVFFAAGNDDATVDNDKYASYSKVIAVAACDDVGKRAPYSDFGRAIWCCFPSNNPDPSLTPGIWTTDRTAGAGYNRGSTKAGDAKGNYTNSFGGTSAACAGAAGVAALVISRNPSLSGDQVRDILRRCCDPIDPLGGKYNENGHSPFYGYGRLNARKAVELARA